jgi:diaminopimelate decarboxylase
VPDLDDLARTFGYGDDMTAIPLSGLLPRDCVVGPSGTRIGRWGLSALAATFGTPLYVYDAVTLRANARDVQTAFAPLGARVSFAAKACSTLGVLRALQKSGVDIDVVSDGEMEAAFRSGFRPEQVHLHGNCKSDQELHAAVRAGIRAVVVDSADELTRLSAVAHMTDQPVNVMIRVSLPLEAETHPWLQTGGATSKFGVLVESNEEDRVVALLQEHRGLTFTGLHTHLGSQISDPSIYRRAACAMTTVAARFAGAGFPCEEVSLGGGWAVRYSADDPSLAPNQVAEALLEASAHLQGARFAVEPGRALVGNSAVALYRVGAVKTGPVGRIVAVDGGMGDNPRPALYGAEYTAFLAERPCHESVGAADIVGRFCEAGDVLARGVQLPPVSVGDIVCVPVAGAYQLAMASSYNLVPQPASVIVDGPDARLMTRRATISDMLSREVGFSDWRIG